MPAPTAKAVSVRSAPARRVMAIVRRAPRGIAPSGRVRLGMTLAANAVSSRALRVGMLKEAASVRSALARPAMVIVRRAQREIVPSGHVRLGTTPAVSVASSRAPRVRLAMRAANARSVLARRATVIVRHAPTEIVLSGPSQQEIVRAATVRLVASREAAGLRVDGLPVASGRHATGAKPCALSAGGSAGGP